MPKIIVFECEEHGEYEYINTEIEQPPRCPECGKVMRYVGTYMEPED